MTTLLSSELGRSCVHSYRLEQEHLRLLERQKRPGSQAPICRASARQGEAGLPEVLLVILLPYMFGADAPESDACLVGACAGASAHSVRGTGTGVREECLHCCALGSLAPRRESAPTARRRDLCWSVSSP